MAPASLRAPEQDLSDPFVDPPACSVDFGGPQTLALMRSLTDVGTVTPLLHDCIAYQRGLDVRLESLLSQRPDLDHHLLFLHRSSHLLDLARSDAGLLLSSVRSTADLANQASRKVRELDLAQSRVHSTLSGIDAIVERSHCLDGARRALDTGDFESAARFVQTFFQIDACFRDSSASDHHDQLLDCKRQLESIIHRRLAAAVDQSDHPSILLGLQDEGLQMYVSCLKKVIALPFRLEFEHLTELADQRAATPFQIWARIRSTSSAASPTSSKT